MTLEEANNIIAKFMGLEVRRCGTTKFDPQPKFRNWSPSEKRWVKRNYSGSLDSLVPVWEKLKPETDEWVINLFKTLSSGFSGYGAQLVSIYDVESGDGKTIQAAACIATAKAIQALNS